MKLTKYFSLVKFTYMVNISEMWGDIFLNDSLKNHIFLRLIFPPEINPKDYFTGFCITRKHSKKYSCDACGKN